MRLPAPPPVRPPTRHGLKRSFNSMGSISPESTGNDAPLAQRVLQTNSKRIKNGLATQLSRGAQVFSSAGSFLPFIHESPPKAKISAPFDFRHVASAEHGGGPMGGTDYGPDSDPEATLNQTHRVLLDVRNQSRIENRTSLPIAMPNVTSPINESQFDAGCGHDSSRNSFNPFPSQTATPATMLVHRPENHPEAARKRKFVLLRINIRELMNRPVKPWSVAFWAAIISTYITAFSTVSAMTVMVLYSDEHKITNTRQIVWLVLSIGFCFISMAAVIVTYARRKTSLVMAIHRNSQNEEELIEMRNIVRYSTPTPVRNSDPAIELDDMTQRGPSGVAAAGQNERAPCFSRGPTTPEPVHIRQSNRIVAEGLHNLVAPPNSTQSKRASGIFDVESVRTALCAQSIVEARPAAAVLRADGTPIGVARSDSLIYSAARRQGADLRHGQQEQHQASSSDNDSPESSKTPKDDESLTASTDKLVAGRIPHSVAVPDLSSETNIPMMPSVDTKSTLSSLISSYADDSEKDQVAQDASGASYTKTYSAPRPKEALGSHPVPRAASSTNPFKRLQEEHKLPHKIVTEAGTPDSQKSTERFPAYVDNGSTHDHRDTHNDTFGPRRGPMTPIYERSEAAIGGLC
ncbi:hypothetical protein PG994_005686 [Apiospora phragmitis]|uniref:Uncharacterized protein n=1 Tax=Apiospora phragmitis TaxID=2905665 RepID=A0ABR1VCY2_9PEZI